MKKYSVYLWQISKQIIGILVTMGLLELLQFELTTILIIFMWFFFLVPPLTRKQEWSWKVIVAQYGAFVALPVLALLLSGPLAILVYGLIVLLLPYVLGQGVSLMMLIAVFLVGSEYLLEPTQSIWQYLLPLLATAAIAYPLSRVLLPLGNGWFIDKRIYQQTLKIFTYTERNCQKKQLITPREQATFMEEYRLLQQTITSYHMWRSDWRARYHKHVILYENANELTARALDVLNQINEADAPQWIREEFHHGQRVHRLLLETLYQDLGSCPILRYQRPQAVYDHELSHSLAIYTLSQYLQQLEQAVELWQKELCDANH